MYTRVLHLVLLYSCCTTGRCCDTPVVTTRHVSALSGREDSLTSLTTRLDNIKLTLEYNGDAEIEDNEWTVDIDYKSTSCLTVDDDLVRWFDEADEALMSWEAKPEVGYVSYEGVGSLKLHKHPLDRKYAQAVCEREGATLAVVDTLLKVVAIQDMLEDNPDVLESSILGQQVLVGINDVQEEGLFMTSTGEEFVPWNVTVWFENEPDDATPGEDCVTFHVHGRIRDVPCYYELPYVCEKD